MSTFRQGVTAPSLGTLLEFELPGNENVNTERVVSLVSENLLSQARTNSLDFNPKPFIRAFEGATEQLDTKRREVAAQVAAIDAQVKSDSLTHETDTDRQRSTTQELFQIFEDLDQRLSDVSNAAMRIGQQLESMDRIRFRAQEVRDVVSALTEANKGDLEALDVVLAGAGDRQTALLVRRLNLLSREVDSADMETAKLTIEKYSEQLERGWLDQFGRAYLVGDIASMQSAAKSLILLNNGASCYQLYVTQHEFFRDHANAPGYYSSDGLAALFDDVNQIYVHEMTILSDVFQDPLPVMNQLLQRIFAETVQDYLESLLKQSETMSIGSYLRALRSAHASAETLVVQLEAFVKTLDVSPAAATILIQAIKQCAEDLFVPYLDGQRYLDKEVFFLSENLSNAVQSASSASAPDRGFGWITETIKGMITVHAEAMERSNELSYIQQSAKNIYRLFQVMLDHAQKFLQTEADQATTRIAASRSEPDLGSFALVDKIARSIQLLELHLRMSILPHLTTASQHEAALYKSVAFSSLTRSVDRFLTRNIEAVFAWVSTLLSRQRNDDFQVNADDMAAANKSTTTCLQVVSYLRHAKDAMSTHLPAESVTPSLTELAMQVYGRLLEHCKNFPVTFGGALIMTKDLSLYYDTLASWNIPPLTERLGLLKELATLFVVSPDNLQSVLSEGILSRIRPQLLAPYLALREDWATFTDAQKQMLIGEVDDGSSTTASTGITASGLFPKNFPALFKSKLLDYVR